MSEPHPPHGFDAEIGTTLIEIKEGLAAARELRAALMDLAYALQEMPRFEQALLVLAATKMTPSRVDLEWQRVREIVRPQIAKRLGLVLFEDAGIRGLPSMPSRAILERLGTLVEHKLNGRGRGLPRVDYASEILKILVLAWLRGRGPMTSDGLAKTVGCTYPTLKKELGRLGAVLSRYSDRRFELSTFPQDAWIVLLSKSDRARHTLRFADRSGKPRSPQALAKRLVKLNRPDVGIGGVIGAQAHYPGLNLSGVPRLDLTVHCPGNRLDAGFIERMDPALTPVRTHDEPVAVAVHVIRRKESFFTQAPAGIQHADPVECLLDLHEAHLESQAAEFLSVLVKNRKDMP